MIYFSGKDYIGMWLIERGTVINRYSRTWGSGMHELCEIFYLKRKLISIVFWHQCSVVN